MPNQYFETEPLLDELDNPREETAHMAMDIARQYIDDLDEYVIEADEPDYDSYNIDGKTYDMAVYEYEFKRVIDGIDTMDYLSIKISSKGNIISMSGVGLGMMKPYENYKIPKEKCIELVEQKLNEVYEKHPAVYKGYEIYEQWFTLAEDNRPVLCTRCIVDLEYKQNDFAFSSGVELVIFLDQLGNDD